VRLKRRIDYQIHSTLCALSFFILCAFARKVCLSRKGAKIERKTQRVEKRGASVKLSEAMKKEAETKAGKLASTDNSAPALVEGLDYYFEGGLMVFTAHFLRRRGYCCANGCRHCPYDREAEERATQD
jgi:hypothetical protein